MKKDNLTDDQRRAMYEFLFVRQKDHNLPGQLHRGAFKAAAAEFGVAPESISNRRTAGYNRN